MIAMAVLDRRQEKVRFALSTLGRYHHIGKPLSSPSTRGGSALLAASQGSLHYSGGSL